MHKDNADVVLLTGANGQLGAQLARHLLDRGFRLRALVRDAQALPAHFEAALEWKAAQTSPASVDELLEGVSSIVHLASSTDSDEQARRDAHLGMPELLLDATSRAQVSRFIALSSIKALAGEVNEQALGPECTPAPTSDYGRFKMQAEALVRDHAANSRLATFTLRLPMVYGPGPGGNFAALRKAARLRLPLPVAADNQRSLLFCENLFAVIVHLLSQPQTPGHRLAHIADAVAISTRQFFQLIAQAEGCQGWCLTIPSHWGQKLAGIPLLRGISERLLGSLWFEPDSLNGLPDWQIPYTTAEGISASIKPV